MAPIDRRTLFHAIVVMGAALVPGGALVECGSGGAATPTRAGGTDGSADGTVDASSVDGASFEAQADDAAREAQTEAVDGGGDRVSPLDAGAAADAVEDCNVNVNCSCPYACIYPPL